jgi:NMD protein affecting ribosome stability and mRNA decay
MSRCEVCTNLAEPTRTEEVESHVEVTRCVACKYANRLPWDVLVGLVLGSGLQGAGALQRYIHATCDYYGRSENELWSEVEQTEYEYTHPEQETVHGETGA